MFAATLPAKGWPPRGGATAATNNLSVVFAFGGADRAGAHYADMLMIDVAGGSTVNVPLLPPPPAAGGHAAAVVESCIALPADTCSTTMIVHGGVNFAEERAFDSIVELAVSHPVAGTTGAASTWRAIKPRGTIPEARTGHTLSLLPLALASADGIVCEVAVGTRCFLLFGGSSPATGPMNDVHLLVAVPLAPCDGSGAVGAVDAATGSAAGPRFSYHWQQLATRGAAAEPREMHGAFVRPATVVAAASTAAPASALPSAAPSADGLGVACTRLHPDIAAAVIAALRADGRIDSSFCSDGVAAVTPVLLPAQPFASASSAAPTGSAEHGAASSACEPPSLVIVGGKNADGGPQRDVCALDLTTLKWAPLARCKDAIVSAASGAVPASIDDAATAGPVPPHHDDAATAGPEAVAAPAGTPSAASLFGRGCANFGWRHLSFGGWDGESGLSGDLLQLDTRPAAPGAAAVGSASSAADAIEAAAAAASDSSVSIRLRIMDSSPTLLRPSSWKWSSVDVRPRPTPAPRFAAAGAVVMLPRLAGVGDASAAAAASTAGGAGAGGAAAAGAPSSCSFALACIGGMTASGDLAEVLILRGT